MQYESTFNAIDNILRNETGCSTELDYIEQTSWLLFLKYLDDLEAEREMNAMMAGKEYKRIITGFLRWTLTPCLSLCDLEQRTQDDCCQNKSALRYQLY